MWRSDPQMPEASTATTASSGAIGSGSGRSSTSTRPGSWKVTASTRVALRARRPPAEERRGTVAFLAPLRPQPVDRRQHVLEPDDLAPGDGAARMVQPQREAGVHVLGRADALADGERRLVHQLADDPPQHQARGVPD